MRWARRSDRSTCAFTRLLTSVGLAGLVAVSCSDGGRSALDDTIAELGGDSPYGYVDVDGPGANGPGGFGGPDPDPTPLPVDDDLRFGRLDNGLAYYLRTNDSPGSNLELRLVVNAGSLQEPAPGLGTAHFLEHMLFNGTEKFPGNELDRVLRELGAEIGPDFNAYTSYDETVYQLSISLFSEGAAETAFDVLAEWAGAATIDPAAVVAERGVVREELRERLETGDGSITTRFDDVYTAGTTYSGYLPIGEASSIETTEVAEVRAFYDAWYRPDNMAVVAVGDIPLDELESLVVERFGGLEARGPAPARTEADTHPLTDLSTHVFTHPDQPTSYISLDFPLPVWDEGTVGGERLVFMESLLVEMLRNRLTDAHIRGDLAQDSAPNIELFGWARELRFVGTNLQADDLSAALTAYMSELLTARDSGFTDADLARADETFRAGLDFLLESRGSAQDLEYADRYVTHFLRGGDIGSTRDAVRRGLAILDSFTTEELTAHWSWLLDRSAPIVVAVGADAAALPSTGELDDALAAATGGDNVEAGATIDELMSRPDSVDPIEVSTILDVGAAEWIFANGARVVFLDSDIAEGAVDLWASASGGWSLLEPGDAALAPLAATAVSNSGLGPHDRPTLNRFLAGSTAWIEPYIDQTHEGFFGGSSTDDLVTLFQLLHLAITEPRVDDVALAQVVNDGENTISAATTDPIFQTWLALDDALYGDDPWQVAVPTIGQLEGFTPDAALAMYEARLGDVDDLIVAVVGDVGVQVVEVMAERYVGTLPAGTPDRFADVIPPLPTGVQTRTVTLDDDVTAAGVLVHHQTPIDVNPSLEANARVLENLVNSRLFLSIREDLGASYGGFASITPSTAPEEALESVIDASGDPDRIDLIRSTIVGALDDLATTGPSASEFAQAFAVVSNDLGFTSNLDLLGLLLREAEGEGDDVPWFDVMLDALGRVTPDSVRDLAGALYAGDSRVEVVRTVG